MLRQLQQIVAPKPEKQQEHGQKLGGVAVLGEGRGEALAKKKGITVVEDATSAAVALEIVGSAT